MKYLTQWNHYGNRAFNVVRHILPVLAVCLFIAAAVMITASHAHAQSGPQLQYNLPDGTSVTCPDKGIFTGRVVLCIQASLERAVKYYLSHFATLMQPAIWAAITLAMVLFGIKIASGQIRTHHMAVEGIMFAFKIGIVVTFALTMQDFAPAIFNTMASIEDIVASVMVHTTTHCNVHTDPGVTIFGRVMPQSSFTIWDQIDCALGHIIGFGGTALAGGGGLLILLAGGLFSGVFAIIMFFVGVAVLFTVIKAAMRPVWVYILAYLMVGSLMVLAPLFVPMLLFQATTRYFERWLDQVTMVMIQPAMVFAFLAFFLALIDVSVYTGAQSFDKTVGTDIASHLRQPTPLTPQYQVTGAQPDITAGGNIGTTTQVTHNGVTKNVSLTDPYLSKDLHPNLTDSPNYSGPSAYHIDFGEPREQNRRVQSITVSLIGIMVVFYLMLTMSQYIPGLASQLVGSKSVIDVTAGKRKMTGEEQLERGIDQAQIEMEEVMGEKKLVREAEDMSKGFYFERKLLAAGGRGFMRGLQSDTVKNAAVKFAKTMHKYRTNA